jgi:hypothetical protein
MELRTLRVLARLGGRPNGHLPDPPGSLGSNHRMEVLQSHRVLAGFVQNRLKPFSRLSLPVPSPSKLVRLNPNLFAEKSPGSVLDLLLHLEGHEGVAD